MAQTTISVRMDTALKQEFDSICSELGLTMSTVVTMLAKKMTREKRLPFEVSIENQEDREKMLAHRATILVAEAARLAGAPTYTQDQLDARVEALLNGGKI